MVVNTGKFYSVKNRIKFGEWLDENIGTEFVENNGYFLIYDVETKEEFKKIQAYEKKLGGEKNG